MRNEESAFKLPSSLFPTYVLERTGGKTHSSAPHLFGQLLTDLIEAVCLMDDSGSSNQVYPRKEMKEKIDQLVIQLQDFFCVNTEWK